LKKIFVGYFYSKKENTIFMAEMNGFVFLRKGEKKRVFADKFL